MKKRKSKKDKKSKFPSILTFTDCELIIDDFIVTDAGFDTISYELALLYFTIEDIINWWEFIIDFDDLTEAECELWDNILPHNYYEKKLDYQEMFNQIINQFEFIPKQVSVATARAVFNSEYQWVKIIDIIDKYDIIQNIDNYEEEAIKLGLKMRTELEDENLVIINDNKHAVANINSYSFYMSDYDFQNKLKVVWTPRKSVKIADKLTVGEATKIFTPDDDFDDFLESY